MAVSTRSRKAAAASASSSLAGKLLTFNAFFFGLYALQFIFVPAFVYMQNFNITASPMEVFVGRMSGLGFAYFAYKCYYSEPTPVTVTSTLALALTLTLTLSLSLTLTLIGGHEGEHGHDGGGFLLRPVLRTVHCTYACARLSPSDPPRSLLPVGCWLPHGCGPCLRRHGLSECKPLCLVTYRL